MSNGLRNCAYSVCCPNASEQQAAAVLGMMKHALGESEYTAKEAIAWVVKNFDLAPPGSLVQFKAEIAKLARENP